jgi:glycosyltransferase involved in cell wall biosynthesis
MSTARKPTISAVVAAYQAQDWIGEALDAILGQSRAPDEVIVVDDGSTDGTARELARYDGQIRVIGQENRGCPGAFNTAFAAARGDFVAMCGADDVWAPQKLALQEQAMQAHPEADVLCAHAHLIGRIEADHSRPPGAGMLDSGALRDVLYRHCCICASSVVIRRELFMRLGPFVEDFAADDYEYWFRCLAAGARFHYDPRPLVRWRQHEHNLTLRTDWMDRCCEQVRERYGAEVGDRAVAGHLFRRARGQVEQGRTHQARELFARSLRHGARRPAPADLRTLAWIAILTLPAGVRERSGRTLVSLSRRADRLLGVREIGAS